MAEYTGSRTSGNSHVIDSYVISIHTKGTKKAEKEIKNFQQRILDLQKKAAKKRKEAFESQFASVTDWKNIGAFIGKNISAGLRLGLGKAVETVTWFMGKIHSVVMTMFKGIGVALVGSILGSLKAAATYTKQQVKFNALMKDKQGRARNPATGGMYGEEFMDELYRFSIGQHPSGKKSSQSYLDNLQVAGTLKAAGLPKDKVIPLLSGLSDLYSADPDAFKRQGTNFAQIIAADRAYGTDVRQIAQTGIPIFGALAKVLKVNANVVKDEIAKGAVTKGVIIQAVEELTGPGGPLHGLSADTLASTLGQAAVSQTVAWNSGALLAKPTFDNLTMILDAFNNTLIELEPAFKEIGNLFGDETRKTFRLLVDAFNSVDFKDSINRLKETINIWGSRTRFIISDITGVGIKGLDTQTIKNQAKIAYELLGNALGRAYKIAFSFIWNTAKGPIMAVLKEVGVEIAKGFHDHMTDKPKTMTGPTKTTWSFWNMDWKKWAAGLGLGLAAGGSAMGTFTAPMAPYFAAGAAGALGLGIYSGIGHRALKEGKEMGGEEFWRNIQYYHRMNNREEMDRLFKSRYPDYESGDDDMFYLHDDEKNNRLDKGGSFPGVDYKGSAVMQYNTIYTDDVSNTVFASLQDAASVYNARTGEIV